MRFKKSLAAFAAVLILVPSAASAAIELTPAGKVQLMGLATQLLTIFQQVAAAQAQGTAYTNSPAFQAQAAQITVQLSQISTQLVTLIQTSAVSSSPTPTPVPTPSPTTPTVTGSNQQCPSFTRVLEYGVSGPDVAVMQLFLARDKFAEYKGSITGFFDLDTRAAVQRYQAGYGIVSSGNAVTTGYGKVGPATSASIAANCANSVYLIYTPPITVTTGAQNYPYPVAPSPVQYLSPTPTPSPTPSTSNVVSVSTGEIKISKQGQSGGPTSVDFSVNIFPNSICSAAAFTLNFGDGQTQQITSNPSCGNQIKIISHVYPNMGQYTAVLTSGTFSTSKVVDIQAANNTLSLQAIRNASSSKVAIVTATYNPGTTCIGGEYTVNFGDNTTQNLTFSSGCNQQIQSFNHTFPAATTYLIVASDSQGRAVTTSVTTQ